MIIVTERVAVKLDARQLETADIDRVIFGRLFLIENGINRFASEPLTAAVCPVDENVLQQHKLLSVTNQSTRAGALR